MLPCCFFVFAKLILIVCCRQIPTEFDFIREAVMMTLVRENLRVAGIKSVVIPRAIPGLVSKKSLCMTYVEGCRPDNSIALKLWGIKPHKIVQALGEAYGQMLLVDGLVHCDRKLPKAGPRFSIGMEYSLFSLLFSFELQPILVTVSGSVPNLTEYFL